MTSTVSKAAQMAEQMKIETVSIHALAEELRELGHIEKKPELIPEKKKSIPKYPDVTDFEMFYKHISDDAQCIKTFFAINPDTITCKGMSDRIINVADGYSRMYNFCAEVANKGKEYCDRFEANFDNEITRFQDDILKLKNTDPIIAEMFKVELSTETTAMKAFGLKFDKLLGQISVGLLAGQVKKETFDSATKLALDMLQDKPVDPSGFGEDMKKFFALYQTLSENTKTYLKTRFTTLLTLLVKCFFIRKLPVTIGGNLFFCEVSFPMFELKPLFTFLQISINQVVIATY
jgi:hypothetical protein